MSARENLPLRRIKQFQPLARLSDDQLVLLIGRAERRTHRAGQKILERGARDGLDFYLLAGSVQLESADGRLSTVNAGTDKGLTAIARLQPRMFTVTAIEPCEFLVVDQVALNQMLRSAPRDLAEADATGDDDISDEHRLLMSFYAELKSNQVSLPSVPDVAWKVRRLADRETSTADDIAAAISADPSMAIKIVRACNSALYRGFNDVRNLREAVVRLGVRTTRQLVTVFAMRELFRSRNLALEKAMEDLWQHSREVAALCHVLAASATRLDPEEALLAGLLHNIGTIPVLVHAERHVDTFADPAKLEHAVTELRGDMGAAVLENWGFPASFIEAAQHADDWSYECPAASAQLVDIVIVSQLHSMIASGQSEGLPEFEQVPAYRRLGELELTASRSLKLLSAARGELDGLRQLLSIR